MDPRKRPSPAMIVASLALLIALGGTATAASHYLITNTNQIKPSVLRELRASVLRELKAGVLRELREPGAPGAIGPAGTPGTPGVPGTPGAPGVTGSAGATGATGPAGSAAAAGATGATGATGTTGPEGKQGKEGPTGKEATVGSWTPLVLSSKVQRVTGFEEPAVRMENNGAIARVRGVVAVVKEVGAGETLFTIPAADRPKNKIEFGSGVSNELGENHVGSLLISPNGLVSDPETPVPVGVWYLLDGLAWNLD